MTAALFFAILSLWLIIHFPDLIALIKDDRRLIFAFKMKTNLQHIFIFLWVVTGNGKMWHWEMLHFSKTSSLIDKTCVILSTDRAISVSTLLTYFNSPKCDDRCNSKLPAREKLFDWCFMVNTTLDFILAAAQRCSDHVLLI